jgi:hypothetical protein
VKSIYGVLAGEWLAGNYSPEIVVIQRNPLNVVTSWLELDMPLFDIWNRADILDLVIRPNGLPERPLRDDPLEQAAWTVGVLTEGLGAAVRRNPGWRLLTHEALAQAPEARFKALFGDLGLEWTEATRTFLERSNRPGVGKTNLNRVAAELPQKWRQRLDAAEQDRAVRQLEAFPHRGWVAPAAAIEVGVG